MWLFQLLIIKIANSARLNVNKLVISKLEDLPTALLNCLWWISLVCLSVWAACLPACFQINPNAPPPTYLYIGGFSSLLFSSQDIHPFIPKVFLSFFLSFPFTSQELPSEPASQPAQKSFLAQPTSSETFLANRQTASLLLHHLIDSIERKFFSKHDYFLSFWLYIYI